MYWPNQNKILTAFLFLVVCINPARAQFIANDTLAQIVKKVFFDKRVYDKIFIKHGEFTDKSSVLLLTNMPFSRHYGEKIIEERSGWNNIVGEKRYASIYGEAEEGTVIAAMAYYGSDYVLFTALHEFSFSDNEANLVFHTTSKHRIDSLADRYVKVTSSLINKKGEWIIKDLKIEKTTCCDEYIYDVGEIIDERHYYYFPPGFIRKPDEH